MKHPDQESLSCLMDGEWRDLDVRRCVVDACRDEALRAKWARYHLARDAMRREPLAGGTFSLAERVRASLADEPAHSNVTSMFGAGGPEGDDAAAGADPSGGAVTGPTGPEASDPGESDPVAAVPDLTGASAAGAGMSGVTDGEVDRERTRARAPAADGEVAARWAARRGDLWGSALGGFALAASVALVTVFGLDAWRSGSAPAGGADAGARVAEAPETPVQVAGRDETARDTFSRQIAGVPLPEVELVANTGAFWTVPGTAARRSDSEERLNMFLSQHIEHSPTAEHQGMLPYSRLVGYDERAPER